MKIFLSHHHRDKPTIREFKTYLPPFLVPWLDEEKLVWSDSLTTTLEKTIKSEIDFLIVFIADDTLNLEWVKRELNWAFEREIQLARKFVLPITLQKANHKNGLPKEIQERLRIDLPDFTKESIKQLAEKATKELFKLVLENSDLWMNNANSILKDNRVRPDLIRIAQNFDEALANFPTESHQKAVVSEHIQTLISTLLCDSERLRNREVLTDYDDCSLLTKFVNKLQKGDILIGLTDWDTDKEWWLGDDAHAFLNANNMAVQRGANIDRIFVYTNADKVSLQSMKDEMHKHFRMGIHVHDIAASSLPPGTPELRSQCVLSCKQESSEATRSGWLTYKVQLNARRRPIQNIFSLREIDIAANMTMLHDILKGPYTRTFNCTEECGAFFDVGDTNTIDSRDGRRLYIHKDSFHQLAKKGCEEAILIYSALVAVPVVKLAFHDLGREAVLAKELSRELATELTKAISDQWYGTVTHTLHRIGYIASPRNAQSHTQPVLPHDESICAICLDSDYFTFATSDQAAQRMYSDVINMSEVRRLKKANDEAYRDLCIIKGDALVLLSSHNNTDVGFTKSASVLEQNESKCSKSDFIQIKTKIAEQFETDLNAIIKDVMHDASQIEKEVTNRFIEKCISSVKRVVLSLHKEG